MSTVPEWHIPAELNQPIPRKVRNPYWGCGPAAVVGTILFLPMVLLLICILAISTQDSALKDSGIPVQAKIVDMNITGSGRKTSRKVYYEYMCSPFPGVKGIQRKSMNTVSAEQYNQLKIGQIIPIVCALSNPNIATMADINTIRASDSTSHGISIFVNTALLVSSIFAFAYLYYYIGYRREQKILVNGCVVPASVIDARLSFWRWGLRWNTMIIKYEFIDHDGKCITNVESILVSNSMKPEDCTVTHNTVVYHPDNSSLCMLYPPTYAEIDS